MAVLLLAGVGAFMTTLDSSIVNISLPSIGRTFHQPLGGVMEMVIIAYLGRSCRSCGANSGSLAASSAVGTCVHPKRAITGAWSLVPTSLWTIQVVARAANQALTST